MSETSWGSGSSSSDYDTDEKDVNPPAPESVSPDSTGSDQAAAAPSEPQADTPDAGETVTSPVGDNHGVEGVQAGDLTYVQQEDGTREYPEQEPVETTDDPTPTPEQQS